MFYSYSTPLSILFTLINFTPKLLPTSIVSYLSENESEALYGSVNQQFLSCCHSFFLSPSSQNYSLDTLQSMLLLYNLHLSIFRVISVCGLRFSRYQLLISILQMFDRSCQPMLNESITTMYREYESAIRDHVNSLA